jgi:hypothetical protein
VSFGLVARDFSRVGEGVCGGVVRGEVRIYWGFRGEMCLNPDKTEENLKKPVETEENRLTKRPERLKVNCGTVLRTRMNTEDSQAGEGADLRFRAGRRPDR